MIQTGQLYIFEQAAQLPLLCGFLYAPAAGPAAGSRSPLTDLLRIKIMVIGQYGPGEREHGYNGYNRYNGSDR